MGWGDRGEKRFMEQAATSCNSHGTDGNVLFYRSDLWAGENLKLGTGIPLQARGDGAVGRIPHGERMLSSSEGFTAGNWGVIVSSVAPAIGMGDEGDLAMSCQCLGNAASVGGLDEPTMWRGERRFAMGFPGVGMADVAVDGARGPGLA
jgi:hypothetical protein